MNSCNFVGRLVRDIEVTEASNGTLYTHFRIAVDRDKENADFIPCVAFGKTVEFMEKYMYRQGTRIWVSGRLQSNSYKNKDGETVYTLEVLANRLGFADVPKEEKSRGKKR